MVRTDIMRLLFCLGCAGWVAVGASYAETGGRVDGGEAADEAAMARERERQVRRAVRAYGKVLEEQAAGRVVLAGFARLRQGDLEGAKAAFQKALADRQDFPPAHYGLALVSYWSGGGVWERGAYTRQTLYHAERAALLYPDFEGPYRLLGRMHLDVLEDYERALGAYVRSLQIDPTTDREVLRALASAYIRTGALEEMDANRVDSLLVSEEPVDLLPIAAQACLDRGAVDLAAQYFGRFFSHLPLEEWQRYYQDIGLIASEEERRVYRETEGDGAARREFLTRFWAARDPDLLTRENERRLEHYRRVWYARTNFSERAKPWDRRGEVYIRYGPPDYRSRAGKVAPPMSMDVEQIKERLAFDIYGVDMTGEVHRGPVYPVRQQVNPGIDAPAYAPPGVSGLTEGEVSSIDVTDDPMLEFEELSPTDEEYLAQVYSKPYEMPFAEDRLRMDSGMDLTFVRWESWVYTGVAGGIEIVFTDERGGGRFDYAPIPAANLANPDEARRMARLVKHSPEATMKRSVQEAPEHYLPGGREQFLDFYYDRANFRGRNGKTRLEIYYGMPPGSLSQTAQGDSAWMLAGYAAALFDPASGEMLQENEEAAYRASGDLSGRKGEFIPYQLLLEARPGTYELRVQAKDLRTGRSGIYKERLEVADYGVDSLRMSDLVLSWSVSAEGGADRYRKGDFWVIPMPTKAYRRDQNPFVYYEIYNLNRDAFGQSQFRLKYTIQSTPEKGKGFGRFLASVGQIFLRNREPEVSVSTEQARSETDLREYFELNLQEAKGGVNRLTVTVTDLTTGQSVQKEALFRYDL